jgi:hypothetical protein
MPKRAKGLQGKDCKFITDVMLCLGKARNKFPGNQHRLAALVEEVVEVATALQENQGPERVYAECVDVACTALRLAVEGDATHARELTGMQLGDVRLSRLANGKFWLGLPEGEGGEFPAAPIEALLLKHYQEFF